MSYTPDNAQLLNTLQNVMVISTTDRGPGAVGRAAR